MIVIFDLATKEFSFSDLPSLPMKEREELDVIIGFTENGEIDTNYDNLSYGFDIFDEQLNNVFSEIEPPENVTIESSDLKYDFFGKFDRMPIGDNFVVFWVDNAGEKTESEKISIPVEPIPVYIFPTDRDYAQGVSTTIVEADEANKEGSAPLEEPPTLG